ncbi:Hypothetical predicted protein [Scomber scombrus]|uniref:Uncharacterized protein n=1 Tax=Scomber scombrus TaxID=13677 RepID=A0AAV1Q040_SCOSC
MMSGRRSALQTGCRWRDERSGMEIKEQIRNSSGGRGEERRRSGRGDEGSAWTRRTDFLNSNYKFLLLPAQSHGEDLTSNHPQFLSGL